MRLHHFCIGAIGTQDLLISKTFVPLGTPGEAADVRKVWATFLDLFQSEHRWTPSRSQLAPDSNSDTSQRNSAAAATRTPSPSSVTTARQQGSFGRPLYSTDCCFVYHTTNDLVLVACCPLPPTPSTSSSTKTRIPLSLPGQPAPKPAPSSASKTAALTSSSGSDVNTNPSTQDSTSASQHTHRDSQGQVAQQQQQQQQQRPELAFSTAVGLHVSLHGMVEFLGQLVKAMERYLLHTDSGRTSEAGPRRTSLAPSSGAQKSSTSQSAGASSSTESPTSLSADLVQLNSGIVYEILDECMVSSGEGRRENDRATDVAIALFANINVSLLRVTIRNSATL
ncbi:hypothetical protein B0O80DRAFT_75807 [Mortierella sp. GBAus27b]|nr:hypothetical protein B0O80DRAFT_75807 [Mortierella sp. GBAus27b]